MEPFERNEKRALIVRESDTYYAMTFSGCELGGSTIGGTNRAALERYARKHGYTPDYRDGRPAPFKVTHGL